MAGTLASLVLKNRGLSPTILDAGSAVGGRLRRTGAQFLRASDPRLATVVGFFHREGLLRPWQGRFGMLGSKGGGFLPAEIVTRNTAHGQDENEPPPPKEPASDGGDFCRFVEGSNHPTFVGVPSMAELCGGICQRAGIETVPHTTLNRATPLREGGWTLEVTSDHIQTDPTFDALVIATHDPSVAAGAIGSIVEAEEMAAGSNPQEAASEDSALVTTRLTEIADSLQNVRDTGKQPVYTLSLTYPPGFSESIPFDAVSVPGSQRIQFLAKESSKPGYQGPEEQWTVVTTSRFAASILADPTLTTEEQRTERLEKEILSELQELFQQYHNNTVVPQPLALCSFRWGAAFSNPGLELKEDSIVLSPWRLSICGDYIREASFYDNPLEAAALSGLEAGERTAAFWRREEE